MDIIREAVRVLQRDGLVVYPTDTIYGLGGDALSDDAVLKVFEAKQRPHSQPISVAVSDVDMLCAIAVVPDEAMEFIERFLPGPVTVVLKAKSLLPPMLTGGGERIGVRIPAHEIALSLISALDGPITATSANLHGEKDPATPAEVRVPHDLLIDGGRLPGTPSTVVDLVQWKVLRPGERVREVIACLAARGAR
ncbi:MAG: L-threonylcarbamoyladenylate synthase [Methanomicrobiales archaeon]|nr:L-threonylcarbamoyladenylate synthase [Methanomicrobiales archaeon]MDI6876317.1 L-threonylcarbamoyladenylate synthase [Methanomicrobiales archaeon]